MQITKNVSQCLAWCDHLRRVKRPEHASELRYTYTAYLIIHFGAALLMNISLHGGKLFLENYSNPLFSAVLAIRG